jgi:uncharacterized membrane protein YoaK (UPF0700 family)
VTVAAPPRPDRFVPLLLLLTVVSGVVDAISYLRFSHVFVANMTGNIVFLGFAAGGAPGLSIGGSVIALVAFLIASFATGRIAMRHRGRRRRMLAVCVAAETLLVAAAFAVVGAFGLGATTTAVAIALLALTMGAQNATARWLAVPDMTTTVLTLTLTGIAAELVDDVKTGTLSPRLVRRLAAVLAMAFGAFAGAITVLRLGAAPAIALALVVLLVTAALAIVHARAEPVDASAKAPA